MGKKNDERFEQILQEISDLRAELTTVKAAVNEKATKPVEDGIQSAYAEFRKIPDRSEEAMRWGFMGAWGASTSKGARNGCISVETTTIDDLLNGIDNEQVAAFASIFTNPHTIAVCKCIFLHGGSATPEQLSETCRLNWEQVDAALAPLQQWNFVHREDERWKPSGQGVNFAITLICMAHNGLTIKRGKKL